MSRTERVEGSRSAVGGDDHEVRGERRVEEWTRRLVKASGGPRPDAAAVYSGETRLDLEDARELAGLTARDVRRAVARALGPENAGQVDEVVGALRRSVGQMLRHEVMTRAEQAVASRLGELRTARHDDAKMARVLGRIGEDPSPSARELELAALGVREPRAAAATLRRSDVRTSLARGRLTAETSAMTRQIRDEQAMERTTRMFESARETAENDPFQFAEARYEVRASLGGNPRGFVHEAMHQAAVEDAEGRAFEGASKFVSSFAASVAGGPVGSVAFGAAEVAIASSEAGVHLAGLLSGASSEEQAREAVIERAATCIGATVGVLAGAGAEHIVPHGWVGRVLGAVMELGAAGKAAEGTRVILRP